ncbi:MAG: LysR family transcriptional regulator, partial [Hyphomicrobiaceae bacterium]
LDTLEIFRAVAHEGGILRAAEKLNRVPSNVSTRVKQVEERLGVALVRRRGRNVVLTDAGRTLLGYAERLLKLASEAEGATREAPGFGQLLIGSMESTAASRLPKLLSRFHLRYPDVRLAIETGTSDALLRKVRDYHIDAAFVGEPFLAEGLSARPIFDETLVLVTSKAHKVVRRASDLGPATVLTFAGGCSYRKRLEEWLARDNATVERVLELASYQVIIACAAAGTGCGIVPVSVVESLRAAREVKCHRLPAVIARNTTHLVWIGEPSPPLAYLLEHATGDGQALP